jgi:hypothetical protein
MSEVREEDMNHLVRRYGPAMFAVMAITASTLVVSPLGGTAYASGGASAPVSASVRAQYPITGIPGWPDPGDLMLQGTPPDTAVVRVHLTTVGEQGWVFLWFGYTTGHRDEGLQLCLETLAGAREASGFVYDSCGAARLPAGTIGAMVTEPGDPSGPGFTIGVTTREVTSVALPPGTGNLTGVVENGRGFPYRVWLMNSPTLGGATLDFRDAVGQVRQVTLGDSGWGATPPARGGITILRAPGGPLSAYFLDGYIEFFQTEAGQSTGVASSVSAWQAPLTVFLIQGNDAGHIFAVGWAPAKAARLVLRLANGEAFAAPTVAGWPGSGLRLWGVSRLPADARTQKAVLIAYNAKGKVIGQTQPT